jgi:hypothetical protein
MFTESQRPLTRDAGDAETANYPSSCSAVPTPVRIADYTSKWKVRHWQSVNTSAFPGTDLDRASLSGLLRM